MNDKTIYRKQFGNFRRCAGFNLTKEPVRRRSEPSTAYIHLKVLSTAYAATTVPVDAKNDAFIN
jgi:hypothetical protein